MQKRKYRINPTCPNCGEEHCCWLITLSEEEQETLDNYYKANEKHHKGNSHIVNMLYDIEHKPLVIKRSLICSQCDKEFEATVTLFREDEISNRNKETVPICVYPVDDD